MIAILKKNNCNCVLVTKEDKGLVENTMESKPIGSEVSFVVKGVNYQGIGWDLDIHTFNKIVTKHHPQNASELTTNSGYHLRK